MPALQNIPSPRRRRSYFARKTPRRGQPCPILAAFRKVSRFRQLAFCSTGTRGPDTHRQHVPGDSCRTNTSRGQNKVWQYAWCQPRAEQTPRRLLTVGPGEARAWGSRVSFPASTLPPQTRPRPPQPRKMQAERGASGTYLHYLAVVVILTAELERLGSGGHLRQRAGAKETVEGEPGHACPSRTRGPREGRRARPHLPVPGEARVGRAEHQAQDGASAAAAGRSTGRRAA